MLKIALFDTLLVLWPAAVSCLLCWWLLRHGKRPVAWHAVLAAFIAALLFPFGFGLLEDRGAVFTAWYWTNGKLNGFFGIWLSAICMAIYLVPASIVVGIQQWRWKQKNSQ